MKKELTELSHYITIKEDICFSETDLIHNLGIIFPHLINLELFVPSKNATQVKCKECDSDHLENVIVIDGKYYTKCEYSEESSLVEVTQSELNTYKVNRNAFLNWLNKELDIENKVSKLTDSLWAMGKIKDRNLYFISQCSLEETIEEASKVNTDNNLFIWLGENPKIGYTSYELISFLDIVDIKDNKLRVIKLHIKPSRSKAKGEDIALDKNIILTKANKLLLVANGNTYNHEEKIVPQAYRIIRFLYDQKDYEIAYKSSELSEKLGIEPPRAIPTRIKEINKICDKYKVKQIIVTQPRSKWILNPDLTCCKQQISQK